MRELRRLVAKVSASDVTYSIAHDLNTQQAKQYLPVVNCRDCGATGWTSILSERGNATIGSLEASGRMEQAGAQFAGAMANYPSAPPALLTQDYLFMKNGGTVVDLSDIRWVFRRIQRYNFVKVGEYLIGKDSQGKERILLTINKNTEPGLEERILDNIRAKNPGLIEGYSREAQQAYSEYRKQVKNGMIPQ